MYPNKTEKPFSLQDDEKIDMTNSIYDKKCEVTTLLGMMFEIGTFQEKGAWKT